MQKSILNTSIEYKQSKIVYVPRNTLRNNKLMAFFDDSPISDRYKILRTKILQKTKEQGLNTILVTSPGEYEGKSLTAANLAISLAREVAHTVLLVDADLRNPSLHRLFGIEPVGGLSDCLLEDRSPADFLINPGINKLIILPQAKAHLDSTDIIGSPGMRDLIREMKHRYQDRYIIFDSPPLSGNADTLILSEYVDGVILVVEYGSTEKDHVRKAIALLREVNLVGVVLNRAAVPKKEVRAYGNQS